MLLFLAFFLVLVKTVTCGYMSLFWIICGFLIPFLVLHIPFYIPLKTPRIRINSQGKGEGQWVIQKRTMLLGGYDQAIRWIRCNDFQGQVFLDRRGFSTQGDLVFFPSMEITYEAAFQWAGIIGGIVVEDNEERKPYFTLAMWTKGDKNVSIP